MITQIKKQVIFLVGPTGIGKSEAAITLAKKNNAEIISCDSMQIYKGIDIISSKPTLEMRKKVRHYLVDEIIPEKEYNVAKYRKKALSLIKKIHKKNKIPLFVGGSGLYIKAVIDGIFPGVNKNEKIRKNFYQLLNRYGKDYLYKKLQKIDSISASKIHPNDTIRIIRALEVYKLSGLPISQLQPKRKGIMDKYNVKIIGLNIVRSKLYQKINERTKEMFVQGLISEVKNLLNRKLSLTAAQAIGIKEIKGYLEGKYSLEEAKNILARNTRRYAKHQLSWFRQDKRIEWIKITKSDTSKDIVKKIMKKLKK